MTSEAERIAAPRLECGTCRFYHARLSGRVWSGPMLCRRYPTLVAKHWTDWCGEHSARALIPGEPS